MRRPRRKGVSRAAIALLVVVLAIDVGRTSGRSVSCKDDPETIGPCFTFHGRLFIANGSPSTRILRLGTKRFLGVSERHEAFMPRVLEERLTWDDNVYGDFTVCPFSPSEPGKMQFVCIEAASRLILERVVEGSRTLLKLPDVAGQ
jgi:hypothetical protein